MKKIAWNEEWKFRKKGCEEWNQISIPHDAMLFEQRKSDSEGESAIGFFTGGIYEYCKSLKIPEEWKDDKVEIEFEGIYNQSEIWVNGCKAGGSRNGYRNYIVDISPFIDVEKENEIIVKAVNDQMPNSRWYTGSGIYRPVNLLHSSKKNYIKPYGVKVKTLSYNPAKISISIEAYSESLTPQFSVQIIKNEQVICQKILQNEKTIDIDIPDAMLWSEEYPELYLCKVSMMIEGNTQDTESVMFGIRKIEWSNKGFLVNGKQTLLRGACVHHDNGVLGAATYKKSEYRRIRILKEQGYNAIRCSHNPASSSMIEACDEIGMYLIDETWDMWYGHKNKYDYASVFLEEYETDIASIIERDYNHPSVIMYSLGNEVSEPKDEKGINLLKKMLKQFHEMDKTRPTTAGINLMVMEMASKGKGIYKEEGGRADQDKSSKKRNKQQKSGSIFFNMMTSIIGTNMNKMANSKHADCVTTPCLDLLDIAGYNYASGRYPLEAEAHPNRIIMGSETFPQDIWKNWQMVKKMPYLIGDFMWTGWDYIGEAGIGAWAYGNASGFDKEYPWLLADVGAVDITGFAGAESYYAATVWGLREQPYIGVQPVNHPGIRPLKSTWRGTNAFSGWSWKKCEGNKAVVEVYANAFYVELELNGKKIGKKKLVQNKAIFKLKYEPGKLTAYALDEKGKKVSHSELMSAGEKINLSILPEETEIKKGDIVYLPIQITDQNGIVECNSDSKIKVTVEGGGILLGFGSANPYTTEQFTIGEYTSYYGRALAVVKAVETSSIIIKAQTDSGMYAQTEILVEEN